VAVVIDIATALLLTLFAVLCWPSFFLLAQPATALCIVLLCWRLRCVVAALCVVLFALCGGIFCHAKGCCGVVLCSAALHVMPWACSLYCGIALYAVVFCIMPQHYASCHSVMHHVCSFALFHGHCALCRSTGNGVAWLKQHRVSNLCAIYSCSNNEGAINLWHWCKCSLVAF